MSGSQVHSKLVIEALESVLKDEGFKIGGSKANAATESARFVLHWASMPENEKCFIAFSYELVKSLERCLPEGSDLEKKPQSRRERMWKAFHQLSSSADFRSLWEGFLYRSDNTAPCPIFYQYVTDFIFKTKTKEAFPISVPHTFDCTVTLSYIERNALRYAAGYIPWSLCKKIKKSKNPNKAELLLCLDDMLQGDTIETEDSQDWIKTADRGGLKHVSSEMYLVICSMEIELQKHLQKDISQVTHFKQTVLERIIENEDVVFLWAILSAPWEVETHIEQELLRMVADLWTTIRGFSYVSSWIEKFKATNKKITQKSRGLRKTLPAT